MGISKVLTEEERADLLRLSGEKAKTDPFPLSSPLCLGKGGLDPLRRGSYTYSDFDRTVILSNFKLSARQGERTVACLSNKVSKTFPTLHQCKQVADALKRLVS